jgi:arsenate reductase (glutaredoxin)
LADITIWHNPRCTKSRQTLALLKEKGVEPAVRLYLEDVPTVSELRAVLAKLGITAAQWARPKETRDAGLKGADEAALLQGMSANPKLIERPVVIRGDRARLGRPPEAVLELI